MAGNAGYTRFGQSTRERQYAAEVICPLSTTEEICCRDCAGTFCMDWIDRISDQSRDVAAAPKHPPLSTADAVHTGGPHGTHYLFRDLGMVAFQLSGTGHVYWDVYDWQSREVGAHPTTIDKFWQKVLKWEGKNG